MNKDLITAKVKELLENKTDRKFKQSIELGFVFKKIDMEAPEHKLNASVFLPKGRGKDVTIGVFGDGDMNVRGKKVSKHVLNKQELESYTKNRRKMRAFADSCYWFIAQPDLMPAIGKAWGIVLGPRGKMPQPVPPNADLGPVTERLKNTVRVRSKKNPVIHAPVGTEDMTPEDLAENIMAVYNTVERQIHKDKIDYVYVKSSMGPAVKITE